VEKIMIIDSDIYELQKLNNELSRDFAVLICSRSAKAMNLFQVFQPAALILDPSNPGLNARDFIQQVRSNEPFKRMPILGLTNITTLKHIEDSFDLGLDVVFSKPSSAERIRRKVSDYLIRAKQAPKSETARI
jgi:DNA-binding response OmpR family regulator